MTDEYRKHMAHPEDLKRQFKLIGTDPITAEPLYAEVHALEPASIGGGGAGGGAVTIADGANVAQGTTTDTAAANTVVGILKAIKAAVTGTLAVSGTFWQATQPVSGTFFQATQPVSLAGALVAGTNLIGDVNLNVAARGGWSKSSQTALTTTATISAAAGKFGGAMFLNLNTAPAYIQCFDTTGAVVLGTTTPDFVIPIPANGTPANGAAFVLALEVGIALVNGLKIAATTTPTGATAVSTGLTGFVMYK